MSDLVNWLETNADLLYNIFRTLLALGAYIYAAVIHHRSKTSIKELEAKKEAETELLKQLKDLKEALERKN